MTDLARRRFLQTTSLMLAGGYAQGLCADQPVAKPPFAAEPTFEPTALFLTWQRDPTTTMTVQWVGEEKYAENRPLWYAKDQSDAWRSVAHSAKRFPETNRWLFRAELSGLEPDSNYVFRVGLDSRQ